MWLSNMNIAEYLRWLFFPRRFIFPKRRDKVLLDRPLQVPGWETLILVCDQQQLKEVNKNTGKCFSAGAGNEFLSALFGTQSVFTMDGRQHLMARRVIGQVTSKAHANALSPFVDSLVTRALDELSVQKKVHVGIFSRQIAMSVMAKLVLNSEDESVAGELFDKFEGTTGFLANLVSYRKSLWGERALFGLVSQRVQAIDKIVYPLISDEKMRSRQGDSIIEVLTSAQSENGYDDRFIRDNIISTIAAGYDTTGSAISWMLFWLSQDGQYEALLESRDDEFHEERIRSFILETLRYCPPLEILPRKVAWPNGDDSLVKQKWGDTNVTLICPCPHLVHHDPHIYDKPHVFDASRFLGKKYKQTEYFPFGASNRVCLGINIAQMIMQRILEGLLVRRRYFAFAAREFNPVRRNVSIWPGFVPRAHYDTYGIHRDVKHRSS